MLSQTLQYANNYRNSNPFSIPDIENFQNHHRTHGITDSPVTHLELQHTAQPVTRFL